MSDKDYRNNVLKISNEPSNKKCIDCFSKHAKWVSLYYGIFMCIDCAGQHRALGIFIDSVRSAGLDFWDKKSYLAVKYGGNARFIEYCKENNVDNIKEISEKYQNKIIVEYSDKLSDKIKNETGESIKRPRETNNNNSSSLSNVDVRSNNYIKTDINSNNNTGKTVDFSNNNSRVNLPEWTSGMATTLKDKTSGLTHTLKDKTSGLTDKIKSKTSIIRDKTVLYGTKIGEVVYSHAKELMSVSSEALSEVISKGLSKANSSQNNSRENVTKHNSRENVTKYSNFSSPAFSDRKWD